MKRTLSVILSLALASATLVATTDSSFAKSRKQVCKAYAKKQADHVVNRNVGTGLLLGAGGGALVGTLLGGKKGTVPGLVIGGVGGTMAGAISGTEKRRQVYQMAYADCMENY